MPDEPKSPKAAGGNARAAKLPASERSAIAKRAAEVRWSETTKEAVCGSPDKPLVIGNTEIECYVLDDGTRVLSQTALLQALGRSPKLMGRRAADDHGDLPPVLRGKMLQPFLSSDIAEKSRVITFRTPTGGRANGYNAELLPEICEIYLAARDAGALQPQQQHIARAAEVLVRGLARVGIIALVDEATGYQDIRTKNALEKILEDYVDRELQPYLKTFPDDFYKEMFRLKGKPYTADGLRPRYFGVHTNDVVYRRLAPGVLDELKKVQERGSTGRGKHQLFQRLTQNIGYPKLREHLGSVVMLMKLSSDWDDFKEKLDQYHPLAEGSQVVLPMERPAKAKSRKSA